jgi:hypothetical protein
MIKFDDLVARVADRRLVGGKDTFTRSGNDIGHDIDLAAIGLAFVQELGLHVGRDGCVHNPAPAAVVPDQNYGVRYRGQVRRRGRR